MLKAIIFDVDGTLAETEETHRAAFNEAFKEFGLDWHWTTALYAKLLKVTGGKERLAHFIGASGGDCDPERARSLIADLHRRKTAIYSELLSSGHIALRPGVAELIEGARADSARLAIATTTSRQNVVTLLKTTLGAEGLNAFEVIAAGDDVPRKKPAPDIFLLVLKQLGLPPENCLAIEDSANGLRAAIGAGLSTLITPSLYTISEDFSGAACVVNGLTELLEMQTASRASKSSWRLIESIRRVHRDALARGVGRLPVEAV